MDHNHIFFSFFLAWLMGALIGIEREMPRRHQEGKDANIRFGGIRSYSLIGIFGALMAWMSQNNSTNLWVIFGAVFCFLFIALSYTYSAFHLNRMGITSEYAGMFVYFNGVLAMEGKYIFTIALTIVILLILASKDYLTKAREKIDREELMNTIKFAVIALVILPILPDTKFSIVDMFIGLGYEDAMNWTGRTLTTQFFNPYGIWFFVVIMAGVEFIGYILSKVMGARGGILLSGAIGGIVSSTTVTLSMTKQSHTDVSRRELYVMAALIANLIMFVRVLLIAGGSTQEYRWELISTLIIPTGIMFLVLLGFIAYYGWGIYKQKIDTNITAGTEELTSPFQIIPAIKFAGIIVLVKYLSALGSTYRPELSQMGLGDVYYYFIGAISGFADVDAITLEMSQTVEAGKIPLLIATTTIIVAMISNNIVKASIANRLGERGFGQRILLVLGSSIIAGIITVILISYLS